MEFAKYYNGNFDLPIFEKDGRLIILDGWNGEEYLDCSECANEYGEILEGSFTARPVYRFEVEKIDVSTLEENSDEWIKAVEIIDFDISRN